MAASPETGFLVLADLTGYTAYLSRSELEHAPVIAGDLLETIIGRLEPPFRLAKLEGDAAFMFVEDGRADPSLLLDAVDAAYFAFRRRLRSIEVATTCDCNACRLAPALDLKLFLHHGTYVRGRIARRDELAGPDVILVHRLLKGGTAAEARGMGFALVTDSAVAALGLDAEALGLRAVGETIDQIGDVAGRLIDLESRWRADSERESLTLADGRVLFDLSTTVATEPAVAWAHLTSPALRPLWEGPIAIDETADGGRRGVGTTSRCVTGRLATLEEVVDWRPYERVGWRLAVPDLGPVDAVAELEPAGDGTSVRLRWASAGEVDAGRAASIEAERRAAFGRLSDLLGAVGARSGPDRS